MLPIDPPTPEAFIAKRMTQHSAQSRRARSRDTKAAKANGQRREDWKVRIEARKDANYAARAFRKFEREAFRDRHLYKPVRPRKSQRPLPPKPKDKGSRPAFQSRFPACGFDVVDRKGQRGIFLKIGYDGAVGNRFGVVRRRIIYAAHSDDVVLERGRPLLVSNVARDVAEAVVAGDELEAFARAERANAKLILNLVIRFPWGADAEAQEAILRRFCQKMFGDNQLPYIAFMHRPRRGGRVHNPHAHVAASFRPMARLGAYHWLLGKELRTDLDGSDGCYAMRKILAEVTTEVMREAGFNHKYTHLSNCERGLPVLPQERLTKAQSEAVLRGETVAANERNRERIKRNIAWLRGGISVPSPLAASPLLDAFTLPKRPAFEAPKPLLRPVAPNPVQALESLARRTSNAIIPLVKRPLIPSRWATIDRRLGASEPALLRSPEVGDQPISGLHRDRPRPPSPAELAPARPPIGVRPDMIRPPVVSPRVPIRLSLTAPIAPIPADWSQRLRMTGVSAASARLLAATVLDSAPHRPLERSSEVPTLIQLRRAQSVPVPTIARPAAPEMRPLSVRVSPTAIPPAVARPTPIEAPPILRSPQLSMPPIERRLPLTDRPFDRALAERPIGNITTLAPALRPAPMLAPLPRLTPVHSIPPTPGRLPNTPEPLMRARSIAPPIAVAPTPLLRKAHSSRIAPLPLLDRPRPIAPTPLIERPTTIEPLPALSAARRVIAPQILWRAAPATPLLTPIARSRPSVLPLLAAMRMSCPPVPVEARTLSAPQPILANRPTPLKHLMVPVRTAPVPPLVAPPVRAVDPDIAAAIAMVEQATKARRLSALTEKAAAEATAAIDGASLVKRIEDERILLVLDNSGRVRPHDTTRFTVAEIAWMQRDMLTMMRLHTEQQREIVHVAAVIEAKLAGSADGKVKVSPDVAAAWNAFGADPLLASIAKRMAQAAREGSESQAEAAISFVPSAQASAVGNQASITGQSERSAQTQPESAVEDRSPREAATPIERSPGLPQAASPDVPDPAQQQAAAAAHNFGRG